MRFLYASGFSRIHYKDPKVLSVWPGLYLKVRNRYSISEVPIGPRRLLSLPDAT